jgi:ATP-dependent RNA helicase RhlE
MSFTIFNFNRHISEGLKRHGYAVPTPIQEQAIRPILDGRDLIGLAQTGTGKTGAFVLPILQQLSSRGPSGAIRSLIVAPTRELAEQTHAYIKKFSQGLNLRFCAVYGGVSREAQINRLKQGVDVVIACPGRLLDLANEGAVQLSGVEILVLDEADQMLDQGFLPDIRRIMKKLPAKRQNLVFSATMPREVRTLVDGLLDQPVEISADYTVPITTIAHSFYRVEPAQKSSLLRSILQEDQVESAIIFTRTKHKAKSLARQLETSGFKATSIQGNLSQQKRQQALDGFKSGTYKILVATDIAARGIDVTGISHVINFDMPGTTEAYTHRTGRTGRASLSGTALTFATAEDVKMVKSLERVLQEKLVYQQRQPMADTDDRRQAAGAAHRQPGVASDPVQNQPRKFRGKRSSKRNRTLAFDFGI